ncbi:MAG: SDR family NAD(P)-dependent oxidoreductase [Pseudomonadota bacterium]
MVNSESIPARDGFGHDSTADEVLAGINLAGLRALVTGVTAGLGIETVRALAAHGAAVTMTARDMIRGEEVAQTIRDSTGNPAVDVLPLDLASLDSVRRCADAYLSQHSDLNVLINNAGIMACPQGVTEDGFELQFGTNHIGHFLFTNLLAPALLKGAPARVVNVSSRAHHMAGVDFDDLDFHYRDYQKWVAYAQSKTANVLFTVALDKRLRGRDVRVFAVHPGVIETELSRHMLDEDRQMLAERGKRLGDMRQKSIPAGAATSVYAATAPELEGKGGIYLEDCRISAINDEENAAEGVRSWALDEASAEKLWALSEDLVGQQFHL